MPVSLYFLNVSSILSKWLDCGPKWLKELLPVFAASATAARNAMRSRLCRLSPSTIAAEIFSRRKMFSKARFTVEVPAPDEPVTAMTGCLRDMMFFLETALDSRQFYNKGFRITTANLNI